MSTFEKWSVWVTSVLVGLTGIGYFWTKYLVQPTDPFAVVNHPLQPWFLKAHILVSPLLLLAVGAILVHHIWNHFRQGVSKGRKSGIVTAIVFLPMVATGYLIQAVTAQGWLEAMAISHIVLGFVYLVGIGLHQVAVQLRTSRSNRRWTSPSSEKGPNPGESPTPVATSES